MAMPLGLRSNSASAQTTVCSLGIGKADFTLAALLPSTEAETPGMSRVAPVRGSPQSLSGLPVPWARTPPSPHRVFRPLFVEGGLRAARRFCNRCTRRSRRAHDRSACRNRHPRCPLGNLGRRLAGSLSGPLNLLQRVEAFVEYAHGRFFLVGEQTVRIALFLMRTSVYSALYAFGSAARPGAGNSSKIDKHWAVQGGHPQSPLYRRGAAVRGLREGN